jgi:quercetin dioxygenase-like cupin family protein
MTSLARRNTPPWSLFAALLLGGLAIVAGQAGLGRQEVPASLATAAGESPKPATMRPSGITATTVSEEKLAHVPGKNITVEIVTFPPLAVAPEHHHGGSVTVYVLSGTIRSQLAGGPVLDYHAGQSFFEPPGAVHVLAENPSPTEPAKFMAIHIADEGAQLTVYH